MTLAHLTVSAAVAVGLLAAPMADAQTPVVSMRAAHGTIVALQSTAVRAACPAQFNPSCEWSQVGGAVVDLDVSDPTWPRFAVPAAARAGENLLFSANCDCGGTPASDIVSIGIVEKSTERTLSALVDFTDVDASDRPLTRQDLADLLTDNADSLDKFVAESSRGLVGVQFDVLDWVTVRKARSSYPLGGGSVVEDVVARLSQAADLSEYDKVFPAIYPLDEGAPGCAAYLIPLVWDTPNGSFELGAAWLSGYDMGCVEKGRMAHEYSHTFGFEHSLSIDCHTIHGVPGSTIDPLDENDSCFTSNYCANEECTELGSGPSGVVLNQDPDMLGGDLTSYYENFYPMHYQAVWQARAGWLADAQIAVAETSDGFWLTPLETLTPTLKAIKAPLGLDHRGEPQHYWLEMRQRYPFRGHWWWDDDPCSVHVRLEANHLYGREDRGNHTYRFYTYDEAHVEAVESAARLGQPFWDPHRGVRVEILNCIVEGEERLNATRRLPVGFSPRPRDVVAHVQVARTRLAIDPPVVAILANGEASVSVRNGGSESVAIGSVSIGGRHPSSFSVASDSCSGASLEYRETCSIAVRGKTDSDTALLRIPSDDELAPEATVSLMATPAEDDEVDDGGPYTPPAVNDVRFASVPANGDAYERDEEIRVRVDFNQNVAVTGTPRLALTIGAYARQAVFSTASDSSVSFSYTVQATDIDADGASIATGALTLNDGTIRDADGNDADLDLGPHAIVNDARHKVAGTLPPAKSRDVAVGDELTLDLSRLFAVADARAYAATSTSHAVTIRIENDTLILTPNDNAEGGVVAVTVTVVHADGTRQTLRFPVTVEPAGRGFWRGWRLALVEGAAPDGGPPAVADNGDEAFAPADEAAFDDRVVGKRIESDDPENYVDIVEPGRFEETEGADDYTGSYNYEKTAPNTGTVTWSYDDGDRCTSTLTFASETSGTAAYECDDGSAGESGWRLVEIPESPSGDAYVRLDDLMVSPGRVQFFFFSAGRCIAISNTTINGVTYDIESSKWQMRADSSGAWADVPDTEEEGRLCSLDPSERGEYRLVAEIAIDGETGMYASNVMTIG